MGNYKASELLLFRGSIKHRQILLTNPSPPSCPASMGECALSVKEVGSFGWSSDKAKLGLFSLFLTEER